MKGNGGRGGPGRGKCGWQAEREEPGRAGGVWGSRVVRKETEVFRQEVCARVGPGAPGNPRGVAGQEVCREERGGG